jgi:L-iditol 2-dehydrogenase
MKALRLHGPHDLRLADEPEPAVEDGEILLEVSAVGLCGSDRHWFVDGGIGDAVLSHPLVLGHEFAATIVSGPRAGERVAVDPADPCLRCALCGTGRPHLCPQLRFAGHGMTDGALRTRMAWPERLVHRVPESLPDAEAALLEPLGVALHALDLGRARAGTTAGVYGCGPLGLLLVQLLRKAGVSVVADDPLSHRLEAAEALGASPAVTHDVEVAFEVAGTDGALASAIEAVQPGGRVVVVGIPDGDHTSFTASTARRKGLTIAICRRMTPNDLPRAIRLAAGGHAELGSLVTGQYPLSDWAEAFDHLVERRGLKAIVHPKTADFEPDE